MSPKRGEGAAKRRELSQRLRRIATGLRIEGAINMAGTLVQAAEVIEASSPSALIAAVEAQMKIAENHLAEAKNDAKEEGWDSETVEYAGRQEGKVLAFLAVLKLLRSPPTEEVA